MKAVAYSVQSFEGQIIAKANQKKHDITLISNSLSIDTTYFAKGKNAVIVFTNDDVSAPVIKELASLGVKAIITRSAGTDHIDKKAAALYNIAWSNVPSYSPEAIAEHAVTLAMSLSRQIVKADHQVRSFDFRNRDLIGFNFYGKTVGLIGIGKTGQVAANIFNGLGCHVIGYDPFFPEDANHISSVSLETLLANADIISLHLPLEPETRYIINSASINQMKQGVMIINTSRGALLNTKDMIAALNNGKVGYLGLDVYEHEQALFFEDHRQNAIKDPLLLTLLSFPNVLVTPHQAYLTKEALEEIAVQTITNLDKVVF